jgi:hypothetical protein
MKFILLIITFIWAQVVCAQIDLSKKFTHQFELGINYVDFFTKNKNLNSIASSFTLGYKSIIKEKHEIKFVLMGISSNLSYPITPNLGLFATSFISINLGYSFVLKPIKVIKVSLGGQLSYRFAGGEAAVFGYRDPTSPLSEPVEARLEYNSIGFSPNAELEYFITKNFGLGVNLNLNYYPFENAKLKGDGTNEPDPLYVQIYKPNNLNFTTTFKLAYKFSFSKINH